MVEERKSARFSFILDADSTEKFREAAVRRKMHTSRFASLVMRLVTRDNLIDAILDDDGGKERPRGDKVEHA